MHDFLLAKKIIDEALLVAGEKKLENVKIVNVEIGTIVLAHDGFPEHTEDVDLENLKFGLESIAKNTPLAETEFHLKKIAGDNWRITGITAQ